MSIFTQQPRRRQPRMSGLGALASMLPALNVEGTGAFLDSDICDYEALVQRVAADLGMRQQYAGKPALAQHDAAIYAHEIWLAKCPAAQSYVETNVSVYAPGGSAGWGRGGRMHNAGAGWQRHPHDMAPGSDPSPSGMPTRMHVRAQPSSSSTAPMRVAYRAQPEGRHAMQSSSFAHANMRAQGAAQAQRSRGGMKGLGDGEQILGPLNRGNLGIGPSTPRVVTQPQSLQQIQQRVQQTLASQVTSTPGTWDGTEDGTGSIPFTSSMPSLSLEGALPGGVAFLLAGALGLVGASFIFGK